MCECKDIEIGGYKRQVGMRDPFNARKSNDGWVFIDICICKEIAELWFGGIKTYESCCGHNKGRKGYIMIGKEDRYRMRRLGYKEDNKWDGRGDLRCFYPKS